MSKFETINFEIENNVARITLNRPEKLNTINDKMILELEEIVNLIEKDDSVKVIVLTGNGKAFCAGADISWLAESDVNKVVQMVKKLQRTLLKLEFLDKVSVASINGAALGGGCELALACDIRIASKKAIFGQPEINFGIIPGAGGTQRLTRVVGGGVARELILTGRHISAEEAFRIGLVSKVVEHDKLEEETNTLVEELLLKPVPAIKSAKTATLRGYEMDIFNGMELEIEMFSQAINTDEAKKGLITFSKEKKIPYKGRWG